MFDDCNWCSFFCSNAFCFLNFPPNIDTPNQVLKNLRFYTFSLTHVLIHKNHCFSFSSYVISWAFPTSNSSQSKDLICWLRNFAFINNSIRKLQDKDFLQGKEKEKKRKKRNQIIFDQVTHELHTDHWYYRVSITNCFLRKKRKKEKARKSQAKKQLTDNHVNVLSEKLFTMGAFFSLWLHPPLQSLLKPFLDLQPELIKDVTFFSFCWNSQ